MNYDRIETLRKLRGITQVKLAKAAGISEGGYANILKTKNTTVETLEGLAGALGVSPVIFWKDDEMLSDPSAGYLICSKCPEKDNRIKELEESNKTLVKTIETLNEYVLDLRRSSRK